MENKRKILLGLNTVRKKVLLLSKLVGVAMLLFYLLTSDLPFGESIAFWVWFALLATVILSIDYILGRMISTPLKKINEVADQMARLNLSVRCDIQTNDEFGMLSNNLNVMYANLQDALIKLETANVQLAKDVEQERILLAQRKELVDTLSHEMKTPLGIIQAYTEGLREEIDEEKKKQYMDVILSATERMNQMIVSLLDLSALEAGVVTFAEERFDFVELVETVAGRLLIDTPDVKHEFTFDLPDKKVFVSADKRRMEQVLNNFIQNAKKYSNATAKVHLSVSVNQEYLRFTIFNQGDAIGENDLARIWDKFYRAGGKRSQVKNGSGLGLAIVAQILTAYGADYGAKNVSDGVDFFFFFPTVS